MGTQCRSVEIYRQADFDARLHMWLDHRDMRYAYEEVEAAELAAPATPETRPIPLLVNAWDRLVHLLLRHP